MLKPICAILALGLIIYMLYYGFTLVGGVALVAIIGVCLLFNKDMLPSMGFMQPAVRGI